MEGSASFWVVWVIIFFQERGHSSQEPVAALLKARPCGWWQQVGAASAPPAAEGHLWHSISLRPPWTFSMSSAMGGIHSWMYKNLLLRIHPTLWSTCSLPFPNILWVTDYLNNTWVSQALRADVACPRHRLPEHSVFWKAASRAAFSELGVLTPCSFWNGAVWHVQAFLK